MRIVVSGSVISLAVLLCFSNAIAQDSPAAPSAATSQEATPTPPEPTPAAPTGSAPSKPTPATTTPPQNQAPPPPVATNFNDVINHVVEREHFFIAQMRHMHPLVETYLQNLKNDDLGGVVPVSDQYYLGRLEIGDGPEDTSFIGQPGFGRRIVSKLTSIYALHFLPLGFAQMVILDTDFQKQYYDFTFVRREFLGEVRCLVIDVQPKKGQKTARFMGRIWVDDQDYNIVRFNGTYFPQPKTSFFFHFDSWRLNMRPGLWLPAYIYTEESHLKTGLSKPLHFKAQTRLWGYDLKGLNKNEEFTQILVESPQSVKDQSDAASDANPVVAQRMWERQAEENAVDRMQKIGLLAPPGDLDKVLCTVVNNLLVTNNIDLQSEVHCRVFLTAPMESFNIGHTIVVSRGLLDVLPDEASLAMVLAHELSHIVLGHRLDTELAFNDKLLFPDEDSFQRLDFRRNPADEEAADNKALELLKNSPYKDKLGNAGLFLKALQAKAPDLPHLIRARLGNSVAENRTIRMAALIETAPALDQKRLDQIAALPLGGRIKVDPWSDQVELSKAKPVPLTAAREKMEFEITPVFPYLMRATTGTGEKVATTSTPASAVTSAPEQK